MKYDYLIQCKNFKSILKFNSFMVRAMSTDLGSRTGGNAVPTICIFATPFDDY